MQTGAQATNSPISLRIQFGQTTKEGAGLIHSHSVTSPRKPIIPFLWWALRSSPHSTNGFWFKPIYPAGRWLNWLLSTASCITDARGGKEASTSVGRLTQHQMHGNFPFGTEFQLFDPPKRVSRSLVTRQEKQVKMKLSGKILFFFFISPSPQCTLKWPDMTRNDTKWHEMTRNDTEWQDIFGHVLWCFVNVKTGLSHFVNLETPCHLVSFRVRGMIGCTFCVSFRVTGWSQVCAFFFQIFIITLAIWHEPSPNFDSQWWILASISLQFVTVFQLKPFSSL
jgi:hypothetical protein